MSRTPHDALFKVAFSQTEHAAAALRSVLPREVAARIDFRSLKLCPGSYIDEKLADSHSDLLFSATLARRSLLIYVLYEHQSTSEPLMAFRLLRYMVRIWDAHLAEHPGARRLPAILPVVLHHSETGWQGSVAFEDLLDLDPDALAAIAEHVPRFRFVLDDISAAPDEALHARPMTALGRLVLWCFRHARQPGELVKRISSWLDVVREVGRAPGGEDALEKFWRYVLLVNDSPNPEEFLERLLAAAGPEAQEEIVSVADWLEQRGRLKGLDEGLREGRQEGRLEANRSTLLKLLRLRFGAVPEADVARISAAGAEQLELWTERVITAASLAEVLGEG